MSDNRRVKRLVGVAVALAAGVLLLLVVVVGRSVYSKWTFDANLRQVRVGDTRERVESLLGLPRKRFAKGTQLRDALREQDLLLWLLVPQTPETWVYGRPRLIWLAPSEEDVAFEFDDRGSVLRIILPGQQER